MFNHKIATIILHKGELIKALLCGGLVWDSTDYGLPNRLPELVFESFNS